jgi:hypothetical protein
MKTVFSIIIAIVFLTAPRAAAVKDRSSAILVPTGEPEKVEVRLSTGKVFVRGVDNDTLFVSAKRLGVDEEEVEEDPDPRSEGLRRLTHNSTGLEVWTDRGVMYVGTTNIYSLEMHIDVPRNVPLVVLTTFTDTVYVSDMNAPVSIETSGPVRVERIHGDVEISTSNWIYFQDLFGSLVAATQFGGIEGSFSKLDEESPIYLSGMEVIDVALPADAKASLLLKSTWGEIFTDFDVTIHPKVGAPSALVGESFVPRAPKPPKPPKIGSTDHTQPLLSAPDQSVTRADVNGGGVEMRLTTVSGNIYVRKRE